MQRTLPASKRTEAIQRCKDHWIEKDKFISFSNLFYSILSRVSSSQSENQTKDRKRVHGSNIHLIDTLPSTSWSFPFSGSHTTYMCISYDACLKNCNIFTYILTCIITYLQSLMSKDIAFTCLILSRTTKALTISLLARSS